MLVIKAEIWPGGDVGSRFEIARIGIINRGGPTSGVLADYDIIGIMGRDRREWIHEGVVRDHFRDKGWQLLVSRALTQANGGPLDEVYVADTVKLLKRG